MMIKRKQGLLFVIAIVLASAAVAQTGGILYGSSRIPQMNTQNPAFYPSNNTFYISLPSVSLNFVSPVSYNDLKTLNHEKGKININSI